MCKYQSMKFLHIISGCPQGRGNGTFLMFAMLLHNKKRHCSPMFHGKKQCLTKKEKHLTKYQVLSSACAIGGGDKRDRTADLLNAIQSLRDWGELKSACPPKVVATLSIFTFKPLRTLVFFTNLTSCITYKSSITYHCEKINFSASFTPKENNSFLPFLLLSNILYTSAEASL